MTNTCTLLCEKFSTAMKPQVPLVQAIYDELRTMQDPEAEAKRGQDSPVLSKVGGPI